jgi:dipeptidyl aminopeptidase/acylaminoacyl peptidase
MPFPVSFSRFLAVSTALVCISTFAPGALAQEPASKAKVEQILHDAHRGQSVGEVAVSPDGSLLAVVTSTKSGWSIELAPFSEPGQATSINAGKKGGGGQCNEGGISWAPDSKRIAFSSDCQTPNQENIYVATISGDAAHGHPKIDVERLTEAKGEIDDVAFSPDGSKIGFLYVEGATRAAGALAAMKPWAGVIGEDGVEIQRVGYVDATGHKPVPPTFATPAALHVYEFDWSPDAKSLAYIAANPPGENNWWVAKLYAQTLGAEPKTIFAPAEVEGGMHGLQIAVPRWSPSGKSIAFIGGLMSDQGSTGGDVWLLPVTGGEARDLTQGRAASPAWIEWGDESHLFVSETVAGDSRLVRLPVGGTDAETTIYRIPGTPADGRFELSVSATRDHSTFVFAASSFNKPPEVYAASTSGAAATDFSGLRQLSHLNEGMEGARGKTESLTWKSDEFNVQGWLHLPKPYDPAKKYPMIVLVHGGPAAAAQSHWGAGGLNWTVFSAMGYFVLEPNPRGSYGQGEAFTAANRKDFGYGDLRDILAGLDAVEAKYPVDPDRVGLTGWSYGGFMTMFGVTQTNRFKAAYAGAGISNWQSYYGENSIDQWMTPYFGTSVYKDPAVYAKSSAINFIDKIKTPTLVVVGDRDGECPAPQSFEFWHALRDQHVPTQLVVYPNEGHGFVNPDHRTDLLVRGLDWFAKYMPAKN